MYEANLPSGHIIISPYTHAAFAKGGAVPLGGGKYTAFADHDSPANEAVMASLGRPCSIVAVPVIAGAAVNDAIYASAAGVLSKTDSGAFYGVVVDADSEITRVVCLA
ncbi:MAG: hypothetical protein LBD37_03445 [Treponema sp.]|jgi:hypothetical protein|nr:hypothetical protein [Treponema sp.]